MRLTPIVLCFIVASAVNAQSIYGLLTVPEDDKVVHYKLDNLPDENFISTSSDKNTWNFTSLKAPVVHAFAYKSKNKGKYGHLFSEANIVLVDPWGLEKYYKRDQNAYYLIAEVFSAKSKSTQPIVKVFDKPILVRSGQQSSNPLKSQNGNWSITLEKYELEEWGINTKNAIRIKGKEERTESMEASGVLYLPDLVANARMKKLKVSNDYIVEEQVGTEWTSRDKSIVRPLRHLFPSFQEYYIFEDKDSDDILLFLSLNEKGQPSNILFKSKEIDNVRLFNSLSTNQFILHPSTTFGDVRLDFISFSSGKYQLEIYNIIGKKLWSQWYTINGDKTLKEDLSFLPKGTYQYALLDEGHNRLVSRRLAIIKP